MKAVYYSQLDARWASVIYSAKPPHTETIKSSGCGITCAAMMIATLCDPKIAPAEMAVYSVKNGFRIDGAGTSERIFPALATKYKLNYKAVKSITDALALLDAGYLVAGNVKGGKSGIFSDAGHWILLAGRAVDGRVIVHDPFMYPGKFNLPCRKGKVQLIGDEAYVRPDILDGDMRHDFPAYVGLQKPRSAEEITADNAVADGIITDRTYWINAMLGKTAAAPTYLKAILDNAYAKIKGAKAVTTAEMAISNAIAVGIITGRGYWENVLSGKTTASGAYIRAVLDNAHVKIKAMKK